MNDITVRYLGHGEFSITNRYDLKQCEESLKKDDIYSIQPKKKRNLKHHNLYWLEMTALSYHTGFTKKQLHRFTVEEIIEGKIVEKNSLKIRLTPSEAFDNMDDENQFKNYHNKAIEYWSNKGYDLKNCLLEYNKQLNKEYLYD